MVGWIFIDVMTKTALSQEKSGFSSISLQQTILALKIETIYQYFLPDFH